MIPTFSPQGDGNCRYQVATVQVGEFEQLIPTFSPQGDGNRFEVALPQSLEFQPVDPYLFPARGRKLLDAGLVTAKGTCKLIPTFSPQGDGNIIGSTPLGKAPTLG